MAGNNNLMKVKECAALLGISEYTLRQWALRNEIPNVRPMGHGNNKPLRFDREDIMAWLKSRKHGGEN